jgi:hypothetical protein
MERGSGGKKRSSGKLGGEDMPGIKGSSIGVSFKANSSGAKELSHSHYNVITGKSAKFD